MTFYQLMQVLISEIPIFLPSLFLIPYFTGGQIEIEEQIRAKKHIFKLFMGIILIAYLTLNKKNNY